MRVLTWNLFHGRSLPNAGHALSGAYGLQIAAWDWDVALLQEVPPWWGPALGRAAHASSRTAPTSRNWALPVRRAIAVRAPDVIKSNGGGANVILIRGQAIFQHRRATLRWWPERRVVHAVRTADGAWWGNLHAQVHSEERAQADLRKAGFALEAWAAAAGRASRDARLLLGGDTNVRRPVAPGFTHLGGNNVDHVLAEGWRRVGARKLDAGPLSDHAPVLVEIVAAAD